MAQETLLAITFGRTSYLGQYLGGLLAGPSRLRLLRRGCSYCCTSTIMCYDNAMGSAIRILFSSALGPVPAWHGVLLTGIQHTALTVAAARVASTPTD